MHMMENYVHKLCQKSTWGSSNNAILDAVGKNLKRTMYNDYSTVFIHVTAAN